MKPSEMTEEQLRFAILRCNARLSGIMPMGYMSDAMVRDAMNHYREELQRRGQIELEFK